MNQNQDKFSFTGWLLTVTTSCLIAGAIQYARDPAFREFVHGPKTHLFRTLKIGEVLDNFTSYAGEVVTVQGIAKKHWYYDNVYLLSDFSGDIMVITEQGCPPEGQWWQVTGTVTRSMSSGDRVIAEKRRVPLETETASESPSAHTN